MSGLVLLVGFGQANQAVARALAKRGRDVVATDDGDRPELAAVAAKIGIELRQQPDDAELATLVAQAAIVVPTPGLPHHHPALRNVAPEQVRSEFDLASEWDDRPVVTVTGTDGKTTVTTMVTEMFRVAGRNVIDAGNNDLPLVAAIDDPAIELFVVEASSFRLGHSRSFAPQVGTWLNFGPDHLDVHGTLDEYEQAKASLWSRQRTSDVAIGNIDDEVVARNLADAPGRRLSFGAAGDYRREGNMLLGPDGALVAVDALPRQLPHDIENSLAAAATAQAGGADLDAIRRVLETFSGLPHRMQRIGSDRGITWFNDSKATTPHAVLAAISGFESVVLIAGGRNKDLDLTPLRAGLPHLRSVVAIGESARDIEEVFGGLVPTTIATSMEMAIEQAGAAAKCGDAVVLSPACTSFDWYRNYAERGETFVALVEAQLSGESE